jgi:hypothetical protein
MTEGKPQPTPIQQEIMRKMAEGWKLHYVAGIRRGPSAFVSGDNVGEHLRVRVDYVEKLKDKGWIVMCSDPRWAWRSSQYALTELGRAALTAAGKPQISVENRKLGE